MKIRSLPLLLILLAALAACGKKEQAQQAPPPPEVGFVVAKAGAVPLTHELVGRLASTRVAEVRARVPGIVQRRVYQEGTDVKEGEVLFQIDPAPLKAALQSRVAALGQAQASAGNAAAKSKRYGELSVKGVIAKQDYDDALAAQRTSAAAVQGAVADVDTAKLNLSYATVTAPISGRAGRALVTEGALVGQGETTPLTTVEQIDPIYVDFSQSVAEVDGLRKAQADGKLKLAEQDAVEVQIKRTDGSPYPTPGKLSFSDLAVDPATGAVSLRATVPNPDHQLLPGTFVKVEITQGELASAFLVPTAAIQRDPQGAFVYVAGSDGKAALKRVTTGELRGAEWVVTDGLADGDQIIVSGIQSVKANEPVKAVPKAELDQRAKQPPPANGDKGGKAKGDDKPPAAAPGK